MTCPDDVTLERLALGLASEEERAHPSGCEACRQRLAEMAAQGEDFHRFVFPRTVDAVVAAHATTRRARWLRWSLPVAAATTAAALMVLRAPAPPDDYLGVKGAALGLAVYTLDDTGAPMRLEDGARVPATAALRFRVSPTWPCHLWLISVDGEGTVSRLFPPTGEAALVAADTTLPGGATLDGLAGPERLLAVCTGAATPYGEVAEAARRAVVPRLHDTSRLPIEGLQDSLLLEKAP